MSLIQKIQDILHIKNDLAVALQEKGVWPSKDFASFPDAVRSIPTGAEELQFISEQLDIINGESEPGVWFLALPEDGGTVYIDEGRFFGTLELFEGKTLDEFGSYIMVTDDAIPDAMPEQLGGEFDQIGEGFFRLGCGFLDSLQPGREYHYDLYIATEQGDYIELPTRVFYTAGGEE